MKKIIFIGLLLLGATSYGYAQVDKFNTAVKIAVQAKEKLDAGAVKEADSLARISINTYPTYEVLEYAKLKAKSTDLGGANMIVGLFKEKILAMPELEILFHPGSGLGWDKMDPIKIDKVSALYNYLNLAYLANTLYGNRRHILQSLKTLTELPLDESNNDYPTQRIMKFTYATYIEDYTLAERIINDMPVTKTNTREMLILLKIGLLQAKGDYETAIQLALSLPNNKVYGDSKNISLFMNYALKGDAQAMTYFQKMPPLVREQNGMYYYQAKLNLVNKNFKSALEKLEKSNDLRKTAISGTTLWELNTAFGEIYTGLQLYAKARDHFDIALLNYPEYKPALVGLTNLEKYVAAEIAIDKTGPEIAIIDPSPQRGLKVIAAGNNVIIKGIATDPAGIKSVKINGVEVFTQPSGDFWGEVAMKTGANNVAISAMDLAGNNSEKTFSVDYAPATEIVAVAEKQGKNICLLIAAQNYFDTSIPSLNNPISDAIKLKIILKNQYNFANEDVISLFNPTVNELKSKLLELSTTIKPEDKLLIFYAGHGIWTEKDKKGYWLMTDSKFNDQNTWLPNKTILDLIAKLPSRHTLLITDACFSGSVFKTRSIPASAPPNIRSMNEKISRVAITSGNDSEVPDESVFMKHLIKALSDNKDPYLTAQKMFINHIIEAVMTETNTEPRYGTLELAGHVGGDFIFVKK